MAFQMYGARTVPGTYQVGAVAGPRQHLDRAAAIHSEVTSYSSLYSSPSLNFPSLQLRLADRPKARWRHFLVFAAPRRNKAQAWAFTNHNLSMEKSYLLVSRSGIRAGLTSSPAKPYGLFPNRASRVLEGFRSTGCPLTCFSFQGCYPKRNADIFFSWCSWRKCIGLLSPLSTPKLKSLVP